MILGLPLYTRVWVNESGRWKSRVLTLKYTDQFISRHKLRPVWNDEEKQYTSSWKEKGTAYKTWLEDAKSLEDKMSLVGKYGLGGTAFWRYGFEAENAEEAVKAVKSGDWVDYGWCTGTPVTLDRAMAKRLTELTDVNFRGGIQYQ